MKNSFLTHLECSKCHTVYSHEQVQTFCPDCKATLLPRYDLAGARQSFDRDEISLRTKGMWRWHELLPVLIPEHQVFLGEGDTPLLQLPHVEQELG
jgi:threonine synthase